MKKFLSILLALALCLASVSAFAADITWAEVSEAAAAIDAEAQFFAVADLGIMMWVPSDVAAVELSEEDMENGYIAVLTDADENVVISVYYMEIGEGTLADFAAIAPEYGFTDVEAHTVNGIPCLGVTDAENDAATMLFATDAGYAIAFSFSPISSDAVKLLADLMMASIQPVAE